MGILPASGLRCPWFTLQKAKDGLEVCSFHTLSPGGTPHPWVSKASQTWSMIIIIQNHTTWWLSQTLKQPRERSHVLEGDRREDNLQRGKKLGRGAGGRRRLGGHSHSTEQGEHIRPHSQPRLGSPSAELLLKPRGYQQMKQ